MLTTAPVAAPVAKAAQSAPTAGPATPVAPTRLETAQAVEPPKAPETAQKLPEQETSAQRPDRDNLPTGPRPAFKETFLQRAVRTALDAEPAPQPSEEVAEPAAEEPAVKAEAAFTSTAFETPTSYKLDIKG